MKFTAAVASLAVVATTVIANPIAEPIAEPEANAAAAATNPGPTKPPGAVCSTGTKAACCNSGLALVSAALCGILGGNVCSSGNVYCCPTANVSLIKSLRQEGC